MSSSSNITKYEFDLNDKYNDLVKECHEFIKGNATLKNEISELGKLTKTSFSTMKDGYLDLLEEVKILRIENEFLQRRYVNALEDYTKYRTNYNC
jgi:hypothetical protein